MYEANLDICPKKLKLINDELKKLPKAAVKAGQITTNKLALRTMRDVRARYAAGGMPYIESSDATNESRVYGKSKYPPNRPLWRSGTLMRLVEIVKKPSSVGGKSVTSVRIKPGIPLPDSAGSISDRVGLLHEFGEEHTITITDQMRRYLFHLLSESGRWDKEGGSGEVKIPEKSAGVILVKIPPRMVWFPAARAMIKSQPRQFARLFRKEFEKRIRFKLVFKNI
jgi:hypothetical protein